MAGPQARHTMAQTQQVFSGGWGEPSPWDADTAQELENKAKPNLSLWLVPLLALQGLRSARNKETLRSWKPFSLLHLFILSSFSLLDS